MYNNICEDYGKHISNFIDNISKKKNFMNHGSPSGQNFFGTFEYKSTQCGKSDNLLVNQICDTEEISIGTNIQYASTSWEAYSCEDHICDWYERFGEWFAEVCSCENISGHAKVCKNNNTCEEISGCTCGDYNSYTQHVIWVVDTIVLTPPLPSNIFSNSILLKETNDNIIGGKYECSNQYSVTMDDNKTYNFYVRDSSTFNTDSATIYVFVGLLLSIEMIVLFFVIRFCIRTYYQTKKSTKIHNIQLVCNHTQIVHAHPIIHIKPILENVNLDNESSSDFSSESKCHNHEEKINSESDNKSSSESECPVCEEKYIHPITLECNHRLCGDCYNKCIMTGNIRCPLCRKEMV